MRTQHQEKKEIKLNEEKVPPNLHMHDNALVKHGIFIPGCT